MSNATTERMDPALARGNTFKAADYRAEHFLWQVSDRVATLTLNRAERKNPITFDSYAEMRDLFGRLRHATDVHAVVLHGAGGNFCSGGDVHEIIGPLIKLKAPELLLFTRMTGELVKTMRHCPQPIVAAISSSTSGCPGKTRDSMICCLSRACTSPTLRLGADNGIGRGRRSFMETGLSIFHDNVPRKDPHRCLCRGETNYQ